MLKHTDSVDSSYRLRTNPLNIRNHDGTDLVLSKVDKLGQMAETRRPVSQIYPNSSQHALQVCPERYEHDSDNDSISEESAFTAKKKDLQAYEKLNYNFNHPYPQQYQDYMKPATASQKTRPLSYPNFSSSGNIVPSDFVLPPPPQHQSSHHSRSSSHESLSNSLSKEITRDREEQVKEGIDIISIKAQQLQKKPAKPKSSSKSVSQPQYIEIDSPVIETSHNIPSLPELALNAQKKTALSQQKSPEEYHAQKAVVEYRLPTSEVPKQIPNSKSFQLELSLASPDLSSLMSEFSQISFQPSPQTTSLGRKNTITSPNSNIKTSPSKTAPAVFERMRSLRKSQSKENFNTTAKQQQQPSPVAVKKQPSVETVAVTRRTDPKPFVSRPPPIVTKEKPDVIASSPVVPVQVSITEYRSLDPDPARRQAHEDELKRLREEKEKEELLIKQNSNQFDDAVEEEPIEIEDSEPFIVDAHIINQLCAIPSPIMNAISFTPPVGSTSEGEDEMEETSEIDSIFSKNTERKKDEDSDSVIESGPEDIPTVNPVDPEDRGRLFVRIEGLSQLGLPLATHRHPRFNMTLDNGIQSVTIDPIPIKSTNPGVNQEFELVVGSDLQFILTFHAQMDALPDATVTAPQLEPSAPEETITDLPESPDRSQSPAPRQDASPSIRKDGLQSHTPPQSPKKNRFRSMFSSSPKKKPVSPTKPTTMSTQIRTPKPAARRPREKVVAPKPRDMWDGLIGSQGEFGRCYLVASQYEQEVYGRPRTFNLSLFDEWGYAEEVDEPEALLMQSQQQPTLASLVPSSNGSAGINHDKKNGQLYSHIKAKSARKIKRVKLEPFKIASVQITLMYIPRVTMADPLPTSIKNAVREIQLVQSYQNVYLEGYLSQEGGDCSYWRRRWFELHGGTLVGHTEDSHKVRNVLHLKNVRRVMDVAMMTGSEKSEMYGVVSYQDRSFQIAFYDGEVINFYADNAARKDEWVRALQIAVTYSTGMSYTWIDRVAANVAEEKAKSAEALAARMKHPAALQAALLEGIGKSVSPKKKTKKAKKTMFDDTVVVHS